ncbi:hypothetical protein ATANTOWER_012874 [Ataeniobius toweri]|uniref:Uncharacterized protein n=1 Tax=Ataeniobius toweri TaxID=208326 RepID=A0ABU7BH04_9TELE|nr:hypothetical protein [Ataeniobius toweri]
MWFNCEFSLNLKDRFSKFEVVKMNRKGHLKSDILVCIVVYFSPTQMSKSKMDATCLEHIYFICTSGCLHLSNSLTIHGTVQLLLEDMLLQCIKKHADKTVLLLCIVHSSWLVTEHRS